MLRHCPNKHTHKRLVALFALDSREVDQARELLHSLQLLCPREASPNAFTLERKIQSVADELARNINSGSDALSVFLEVTLARHTLVDLCMERLLEALTAYSPGLRCLQNADRMMVHDENAVELMHGVCI